MELCRIENSKFVLIVANCGLHFNVCHVLEEHCKKYFDISKNPPYSQRKSEDIGILIPVRLSFSKRMSIKRTWSSKDYYIREYSNSLTHAENVREDRKLRALNYLFFIESILTPQPRQMQHLDRCFFIDFFIGARARDFILIQLAYEIGWSAQIYRSRIRAGELNMELAPCTLSSV